MWRLPLADPDGLALITRCHETSEQSVAGDKGREHLDNPGMYPYPAGKSIFQAVYAGRVRAGAR